MQSSDFYDAGPIKQIAINLFYGWGYNFYRKENQLRADDLLVRGKVSWLLGAARASVESAESAYRREFLPPPSRAKPSPEAGAVAAAQSLERLSRSIGEVEAQVRAQPAPENDRMSQRHRQEAATLTQLLDCDQRLAGQSEMLRSLLDQKDGAWLVENVAMVAEGIKAISATLRDRQAVLLY